MVTVSGDNRTTSPSLARFAGSGVAGLCELTLFHPVDTIAKRLMNTKEELTKGNFNRVLFHGASNEGVVGKYASLFGGFGYGALYKVSQRIYKFGGQPVLNDFLQKTVFRPVDNQEISKNGKFWSNAIAGSILGAGEIVLLPFDVMKIKSQTNPEIRKMGFSGLVKQEGFSGLYAGAGFTAARNIMGSFMLFGVNSYVKSTIAPKNGEKPSFVQLAISSTAGSVSSILVACPLDVVKTRMQSGSHAGLTGTTIIKNMYKQEGIGGFFKGAVPKVAVVGPKLIFSFTLAQYLIDLLSKN